MAEVDWATAVIVRSDQSSGGLNNTSTGCDPCRKPPTLPVRFTAIECRRWQGRRLLRRETGSSLFRTCKPPRALTMTRRRSAPERPGMARVEQTLELEVTIPTW